MTIDTKISELGGDSLDQLDIILSLEEELGIILPVVVEKMKTPLEFYKYLISLRKWNFEG